MRHDTTDDTTDAPHADQDRREAATTDTDRVRRVLLDDEPPERTHLDDPLKRAELVVYLAATHLRQLVALRQHYRLRTADHLDGDYLDDLLLAVDCSGALKAADCATEVREEIATVARVADHFGIHLGAGDARLVEHGGDVRTPIPEGPGYGDDVDETSDQGENYLGLDLDGDDEQEHDYIGYDLDGDTQ